MIPKYIALLLALGITVPFTRATQFPISFASPIEGEVFRRGERFEFAWDPTNIPDEKATFWLRSAEGFKVYEPALAENIPLANGGAMAEIPPGLPDDDSKFQIFVTYWSGFTLGPIVVIP